LGSFDVLMSSSGAVQLQPSTSSNVWTHAGDVNFLYVMAAYFGAVQRATTLPIENTIKEVESDTPDVTLLSHRNGLGCDRITG
jgi:hypothetical protein